MIPLILILVAIEQNCEVVYYLLINNRELKGAADVFDNTDGACTDE